MRVCILAFLLIFGTAVCAQTSRQYMQRLEATSNADDFLNMMDTLVALQYTNTVVFQPEEFKEMLEITRKKDFASKTLPRIYGWMGSMYANGRLDQAMVYFLESINTYEAENRKLEQALVCFQVGLLHHKAKNYNDAREYYLKTLDIGKQLVDARTTIGCYNGLGLIYREENKLPEAISMFKTAADVADKNHDIAWHGILKGNIGSIFRMRTQYDSSLYYYFQNLKYIRHTSEVENIVETYAQIGRVYLGMRNYKNAKIYLDSAQLVLKNSGRVLTDFFNPFDLIYQSYSTLYAETGDFKKAYDYYLKFHKVEEQKETAVKGRSLAELQSTYTYKKKLHDLDYLQKINEANEIIITQQRYGQIALLIIMLAALGVAFFVYKTSRQRKKLNRELNALNTELERSNATKDKLFSVLSHDLRGPINNLRGVVQLQRRGLIDKDQFNEVAVKLDEQLETTSDTLNNLLQWARSQMSGTTIVRENIILAETTQKIIQQLDTEVTRKNIVIDNSIPAGLTIRIDREQYEIIIRNLLGNAIKFSHDNGRITIAARILQNEVDISVKDEGTGINGEDLKNLFKPGRHFSKEGTHGEKGTGVGLVITREMILANRGDIRVQSERNMGSTFTVTLPLI